MVYFATAEELSQLTHWSFGSLARVDSREVWLIGGVVIFLVPKALEWSWDLNSLSIGGDEFAISTGVDPVDTRKKIIEEHILQGVVSLPSGIFQPYSGVSTSILLFQKTDCGGTERVWFYHMKHDGFSLNATRTPTEKNDIPDIVNRWKNRQEEGESDRTSNCFFVPKSEIVANNYDLSFRRYQHIDYEEEEYQSSHEILDELKDISNQIQKKLSSIQDLLQ